MGAIQVKNVPEDLHEALRRRAVEEGMDLQDYLLRLIRRELALPSEHQWLRHLHAQPILHGLPPADQTLAASREEREDDLDRRADRN
ncbi:MAG: FitA-like ribbon-helix-helix domain-containing protein [Egibacteraceae bacterium]